MRQLFVVVRSIDRYVENAIFDPIEICIALEPNLHLHHYVGSYHSFQHEHEFQLSIYGSNMNLSAFPNPSMAVLFST